MLIAKERPIVLTPRQEIDKLRDAALNHPESTVSIEVTTGVFASFQTDPDSLKRLNDTMTTFLALGGAPAGFEWRDVDNVNHPADLTLLGGIAAAKAASDLIVWQKSWADKDALV